MCAAKLAERHDFNDKEEYMLTRIAIGLMAGTLLSAPVLAQTQAPTTNAPASTTTAPATQGSSAAMPGGGNIQYITQNRPDLWRASKLEGVNVYNQSNERIGEINEVLVDKQGKVEAVVIGVGGFLGIGERSVAVPFNALQWQNQAPVATSATTTTAPAPGTAGTTATNTTAAPSTTGTVAVPRQSNDTMGDRLRDYPERAILANATKDQLKNAPEFKYSNQ